MSPELIEFLKSMSELPLHGLLLAAVVVLWRRLVAVEAQLAECLGKPLKSRPDAKKDHTPDQ